MPQCSTKFRNGQLPLSLSLFFVCLLAFVVCLLLLLFCFVFSEVRRQLHEWTRLPCPRDNPWKVPLVNQKAFGVTRKRGRQCDSQLLGGCIGSPAGQQHFSLQHMQSPKSHFSFRNCVGHLIFPTSRQLYHSVESVAQEEGSDLYCHAPRWEETWQWKNIHHDPGRTSKYQLWNIPYSPHTKQGKDNLKNGED